MAVFSTAVLYDVLASRPTDNTVLTTGRLFYANDTHQLFRDNGTGWDEYTFGAAPVLKLYAATDGTGVTLASFDDTAMDLVNAHGALAALVDLSDTTKVVITPDSAGDYLVSGGVLFNNNSTDAGAVLGAEIKLNSAVIVSDVVKIGTFAPAFVNLPVPPVFVTLVDTDVLELYAFNGGSFSHDVDYGGDQQHGATYLLLEKI